MTTEVKQVELLTVDKINYNGVTVTKQAIQQALAKLEKDRDGIVYGQLINGSRCYDQPYDMSHRISNLKLDDDRLLGDVYIFDSADGCIVQRFYSSIHYGLTLKATPVDNQLQDITILQIDAMFK